MSELERIDVRIPIRLNRYAQSAHAVGRATDVLEASVKAGAGTIAELGRAYTDALRAYSVERHEGLALKKTSGRMRKRTPARPKRLQRDSYAYARSTWQRRRDHEARSWG